MRIQNTVLRGEKIEFPRGESNIVGPNVIFEECEITSRASAKNLTLFNVRMVECDFRTSARLRNANLCGVIVDRCRITGHFSGCSFGSWPEYFAIPVEGDVIRSDFSQSVLDNCRFVRCSIEGSSFPQWPCFTILSPNKRKEQLLGVSWEGDVQFLMESYCDSPPGTVAVCGHAESIVKRYGATEAVLRKVLSGFDWVLT